VINRHDGSALSAGGDIGGTDVVDDGDAEPFGKPRPVAELHGQFIRRLVDDRLAVKADDVDGIGTQAGFLQKIFDGLGVCRIDECFGLGEDARPVCPLGNPGTRRQSPPQQRPFPVGIGTVKARAERRYDLAIGVDQGGIHPVQ
jgi:hypothetical protein